MPDFHLNSYKDYQDLLRKITEPLDNLFIHRGKDINNISNNWYTNYPKNEEYLELFSRTLLGTGLLQATDLTTKKYLLLIKKGITPNLSEYWGKCYDNSQIIVEMFPILHFCVRNVRYFNNLFSCEDKKNFQQWFLQINKVDVCNNNWHFFPILINIFLQKLQLEYDQQVIEKSWESINKMYIGNGWYSDGYSRQIDYYNSFAFHFYSLLYAFYSNDKDRIETIKQRADLFAQTYIHFFAVSGESIPYGRSLTYKFAHISFWSIYSNFIDNKEHLGIIKGIINRNLRWWSTKDVFNKNGLLINGYTYDNPYMLEQYNGIGSPYWAFKAFYCMLNPDSEYFNIKELPYPQISNTQYIPEANLCIQHCEGHSYAFINGQQNSFFCNKTAKYEKFVYSTLFGFNISRSFETLEMLAPDNTLAIKIDNNIIVRNNTTLILNDDNVQISDWCPIPTVTIRSFIFKGAPWHVRVHYVISTINLSLFDFGFAINSEDDNLQKNFDENEIFIIGSRSCSGIVGLKGETNYIKCVPNTNILYPHNLLPFVRYNIHPGRNLYTTTVYGNVSIDNYSSRPSVNCIKRINDQLIAFKEAYNLPRTSILQYLFIIITQLYNKLSFIYNYIRN